MKPGLRQIRHIRALGSGQAAACVTDENHHGALGFLDRDRMPQPVVVRNARDGRHLGGMVTGAEHDGETNERPRGAEGVPAIGG